MSSALFNHNLKGARRDALVSHYLATHDFSSLPEGRSVATADDLYEYLLLDTKISDSVRTSRLAEAISSLQLYIHRGLEGYEGDLANDATQYLAKESFLDNWARYNKRYSTWAGKEKLRFYAGNYVEPSLRVKKTELFKTLEASLEAGKLSHNQIYNNIVKYIHDYQERADLEYISTVANEDTKEIYYIGRYNSYPTRFYWRKAKCDESENPTEWGEWYPLDSRCGAAIDNIVIPMVINNTLHIYWHTEELTQGEDGKAQKIHYYNEMAIDKSGVWSTTKKEALPDGASSAIRVDLPAIAKTHSTQALTVASLPILPWVEKGMICLDQAYDKDNKAMHFLCKDSDGFISVNTAYMVRQPVFSFVNYPNVVYGKKLRNLKNISKADAYSLYVKNGWVWLEYSCGEQPNKMSYQYLLGQNDEAVLQKEAGSGIISHHAIKFNSLDVSDDAHLDSLEYSPDRKHIRAQGYLNIGGAFEFELTISGNGKEITIHVISSALAMSILGKTVKSGETVVADGTKHVQSSPIVMSYKVVGTLNIHYQEVTTGDIAWDILPTQYGIVNSDQLTFVPPESSTSPAFGFAKVEHPYPMFDLTGWLAHIDDSTLFEYLYRYELQNSHHIGGMAAFSGHNGMYLWEIFFHIPYLIATRFSTEQNFEEAERWYKYIFNSAGYRDEDGHVLKDEHGRPLYWNCYPLQEDVSWDSAMTIPASTDPDVIATADPMHYKLAIFEHVLDLLIARGDAAFRQLERDTLTEAKMYYVQALQLLGPRPDIRVTNTWDSPTLEQAAGAIDKPTTRDGLPQSFAQWLRAGDRNEMGDGDFLPPYNDVLLAYWDKLDIRLFNLRHNLNLNGQPLDLPLFATPADPKELHRQQSGGDGVQGSVSPANDMDTGWRYPLLADHARNAASQLSQFGSNLLNALERRDSEQLTLLLQSQQIAVLDQQQEIAQKNLDSLTATLTSFNASLASAQLRKRHYTQLMNGNLSAQEQKGLTLRTESRGLTLASNGLAVAGGALSALPNTFGLANGGGDFGAPLYAASQVLQMVATANEQAAVINDISAGYQRRSEEWGLQSELADKDVEQMQAQIDSLNAQIAMQQKQILLTETESANAQAMYDLQSSRFTGQALYNWMVGRLSTLYYQLYDNTVPVCLQARKALTRELGSDKVDGLFNIPVWNDLYQGLLAGEGLTSELQKLNNVWLQQSALGLEATRTVSLATLRGEERGSLSTAISKVLLGTEDGSKLGKLTFREGIFSAVLDLSTLGLDSAYNDSSRRRFIKSISVTLPTLLGPYQDIEASLSGGGQMATLSHGMQDTGRFVTNFDDSRFLPFEGMELKKDVTTPLTLSIFNVKGSDEAAPNQRAIVENLSDIIFHIHYIMR